ncbi:hypothetical protein COLO4_33842 [Corchorus olitorius]|uniref:Uncharacterized protein n=1 Tax=Corchorus olitorius TaxID=93759 RepID=A0A1R3GQR2_9ROSI|nr:hypothetical protein COLO4_33842 [Corchorus olitorius]
MDSFARGFDTTNSVARGKGVAEKGKGIEDNNMKIERK